MRNPPNAGERNRLPRIATYGLQIVSPSGGSCAVAGIDDPGPGVTLADVIAGKGGGPADRTGTDGVAATGNGGGPTRGLSAAFGSVAAGVSSCFSANGTGSVFFSVAAELSPPTLADTAVDAARNSEIGFQHDFR